MAKSLGELQCDLIAANHILHYHKVVDAYGHISIRHPENPDIYMMSGSVAPALVESPDDLIEYYVSDSSPVSSHAKGGYLERHIHGEIFKRYPDVNCVIHSHSETVLAFTVARVPLVPVFHMAGFLGSHVPLFDIVELYSKEDPQNMLVSNAKFGAGLAATFTSNQIASASASRNTSPDHSVVLMEKHGFTTLGTSIPETVFRALYTQTNAGIQTNALLLRDAMQANVPSSITGAVGAFSFLTEEQARDCQRMNAETQERPWRLWVREVEASNLYINKMSKAAKEEPRY